MHFLITPQTALIYIHLYPRTTQVYNLYYIILIVLPRPRGSHECSKHETYYYIVRRGYTLMGLLQVGRWSREGEIHCTPTTTIIGREICEQNDTIRNNVLLLRIFKESCSTVWTEFIILSLDVENLPMDSGLQVLPHPYLAQQVIVTAVGGLMDSSNIHISRAEPQRPQHNATLRSRPGWLLEYNYCQSSKGLQQHFIGNRHASLYGSGGESTTFVQNHCTTKLQQVS